MKANDVLTLANRATRAKRHMIWYYDQINKNTYDANAKELLYLQNEFYQYKENFCSLMDCIALVSRDAVFEFRHKGLGGDNL